MDQLAAFLARIERERVPAGAGDRAFSAGNELKFTAQAGGAVRTVLEMAGIKNIVAKSIGSSNPINVVRATISALQQLKDPEEESAFRGIKLRPKFSGEDQ
jgi:hypothetical protein